ncbi:MAG: aspartate ammonia-lyase [Elusimicrobia bacterium]|nr:aspartate ammonia-lyase [Elusimicrobiota bacterium]
MRKNTRLEKDSLGTLEVPAKAYYGIQTCRAKANFPVSGLRAHPALIMAYAAVKKACCLANAELGSLDRGRARAISRACDEILAGRWDAEFVVDVYGAGAGTSFNMNANEVIANRAEELLGGKRGEYRKVHPNDHVNMGQSTNDTFPTATYAAVLGRVSALTPVLAGLAKAFRERGRRFDKVVKSARTHLQDAVPITLGQEFRAYAAAIDACAAELDRRSTLLSSVALGATAAGTGATTLPGFRAKAVRRLAAITGLPLKPGRDPRMALQSHQPLTAVSGALRDLALELIRVANDLRLLASGPTTGFAELVLPAVQPGSSIMPGKVNPSMAECLDMIGFQIVGRDQANALAAQAGQLDLNVMTPLTCHNLLDSIDLLLRFLPVFQERCVTGIEADRRACAAYFRKSPSLVTLLSPAIGYAKAAELFKEAVRRGVSVYDLVVEKGLLSARERDRLFDPIRSTGPLR